MKNKIRKLALLIILLILSLWGCEYSHWYTIDMNIKNLSGESAYVIVDSEAVIIEPEHTCKWNIEKEEVGSSSPFSVIFNYIFARTIPHYQEISIYWASHVRELHAQGDGKLYFEEGADSSAEYVLLYSREKHCLHLARPEDL